MTTNPPQIGPTAVGVKVTVNVIDPPAATVPLVGLAVKTAFPVLMPLTVSVLFPVLVILNVLDRLEPMDTAPPGWSERISHCPDRSMMRVPPGVGMGVGAGVVVAPV